MDADAAPTSRRTFVMRPFHDSDIVTVRVEVPETDRGR